MKSTNRIYNLLALLLLTVFVTAQEQAPWPAQIEELTQSVCLIEFYQPQYSADDITDNARIKRKLTGFLVKDDGLIMTSDEIFPAILDATMSSGWMPDLQPPEDITVTFKGGSKRKAELVGKDEEYKVAFVRLQEKSDLPAVVEFRNRKLFRIGEPLYFVEHLGDNFDNELIVTRVNINSVITKPEQKLLTVSSLDPLSSGGLAVDAAGNVIGVVQRNSTSEIRFAGHGFNMDEFSRPSALASVRPGNQLTGLIEKPPTQVQLKQSGGKSWLGIQMQILKKSMAKYWGLENTSGIIVNQVMHESPAEEAGIKTGDIITQFGELVFEGDETKNQEIFRNYIRSLPYGEAKVRLIRDGKQMTKTVVLRAAPKSKYWAKEYSQKSLGLSVKELTQDIILGNDLDFDTEGVWVSRVEEAGSAGLAGLAINDLILQINSQPVRSIEDFTDQVKALVSKKPSYITLFIQRSGKTRFLFLRMQGDENSGI